MRVQAIKLGYYNHARKKPGDIFNLNDEKDFSERWMVESKEETGKKKRDDEDLRGPVPLSKGSKAVHTGTSGRKSSKSEDVI